MILVTCGTQEPFDRLLAIIDKIAPQINDKLIVQCKHGDYDPQNFRIVESLPSQSHDDLLDRSSFVIAHAGMGTIIKCIENGKPLIVFPRQAILGEHRTDHQIATARQLERTGFVKVAWTDQELEDLIKTEFANHNTPDRIILDFSELTDYVKDFIGI